MQQAGVNSRACALAVLGAVLGERTRLSVAIEKSSGLDRLASRDRAHVHLMVATTLRRLGQVDTIIDTCLRKPLHASQGKVHHLLRLGATQLLFLETPAHAVVNTSVALAREIEMERLTGLINAVLRRVDRERHTLLQNHDAPRLNTPTWLWDRWSQEYGEPIARAIAEAHAREPPRDLTPRDDPATLATAVSGNVLPTGTVRCAGSGRVADLPGYADGLWWVQDAAAALPARLLHDVAGRRVLDLCAAPGGKTAQLAAAGAHVTAVDASPARLRRVADNLARLRLDAKLVAADATSYTPSHTPDAVLLDAPCTATGTIRRHPDVAHLKAPADLEATCDVQSRLLRAAIAMLPKRGTLVYTVCSLQPEEGPKQIAALLDEGAPIARHRINPSEIGGLAECITPAGDLRTLPCHLNDVGGMDGFYACRLTRI